ncbi:SMI1/KNR4 family protein [Streptomyces sp. NPDC054884]|uniref:SMI1/KNR4 family protein n=1 Tax=Streptomyces sp. ME08-AFT2 TaxID=3028683 RepID=UPI0029ABCE56|nr:SMI1/KNR4 family protein [Streptomyces sp. ME08-AFT2]MDX3310911.1 SMI1/KNR4 family protein [Streptomyces sp. ME08-AFT2]
MSGESFDWQDFLGRWQEEWVPDEEEDDAEDSGPGVPLGRPGADEAAIAAAEERLGRRLPPSYRAFLTASDGWRVDQTAGVYVLGCVADIGWFQDPHGLTPLYEQELGDDPREEEVLLAGMWQRALRLETDSDMSSALLDPGDSDQDGEWALYVHKGWSGELPERYPSFRAYMEAMYRGFHGGRAGRPDFVNATTRAQDARVEEARLLALRGRYEEALPLLEEAQSFGRPHSRILLQQLQHLMTPGVTQDYGLLAADPRCLSEILPVEAMAPARGEWRLGGDDHWLGMMTARGVDRKTAEAVLSAMRDGVHRYAPPGPWGRAVAEAWEEARWGATDAAWRVLRDALALWEAPGPALIAPIGLLADPFLGPLITPERGREILATPRAGEAGPAHDTPSDPVPDLDPPGLTWLTEPAVHGQPLDGYRCVWVEGADPAALPALIGQEGAELDVPTTARELAWRAFRPRERDGVEQAEAWEDRAVVAAGRTAQGWAFAFDGHSGRHLNERFTSPAAAASASGRAVVVWREPRSSSPGNRPAAFHLSVAERGQELYAFTVRGTEIRRSGEIPERLDPARLFCPEVSEPDSELRALEALHLELGLSLPRFALTRGRLRTFTTRSWTRAPREGERYVHLSFVRHRHQHRP